MALNYLFRLLNGRPKGDLGVDFDLLATKEYVEGLVQGVDWQESIQHSIQYVKTTAGAPSGTPSEGEKCLNTNEGKLYTAVDNSGWEWDAGVAVSANDRFVHKDDGSDTSGDSGTYAASNKVYQYGSTFDEFTPNEGSAAWLEDLDSLWVFNGTNWVRFGTTITHNNLNSIQGGDEGERYHLTADQQGGIAAATTITAANPPLTLADRAVNSVPFTFAYLGGLAASQSDVEAYEQGGAFQRIVMPDAGSIVRTTAQSSSPATAGNLIAEPTINGTKATENALDLTLSTSDPSKKFANADPGTTGLTFAAGDEIGVKLTTDASWANAAGDLQFTLFVVFDKAGGGGGS